MIAGQPLVQPGSSSITDAVAWIDAAVRGQVATAIAVIAVALLGYGMLFGRISVRDAARTVLGCFILFGAPLIAQGLIGASQAGAPAPPPSGVEEPPPMLLPPPVPSRTGANPFDPYSSLDPAGAAQSAPGTPQSAGD
jgi:type IV secretory pathway VirB2 component (pilin)